MQHGLAPSPGLRFPRPAELQYVSKIVGDLECIFEHGKLTTYIDFETLLGCVMDYRCVLYIKVLVFGYDVWSLSDLWPNAILRQKLENNPFRP
jgi:hypothetical protein